MNEISTSDITGRNRAEEAKFFLASIVESSEDSIVTINFEGVITSWNRAAEKLYGYPANEAVGKPLTMLTLPGDLREVLSNIEKIKHSRKIEIYDTVRVHKDGHEMLLEIVLSPVKDDEGQIIGASTVARNVTEQRKAVKALRESEEKYHRLFDSIDEGFCLLERVGGEPVDFRYLEANPAFVKQIGVSNVVGKTIREMFPGAPEEGYELYERVWQTGEPERAELDVPSINHFIELYAFLFENGASRCLAVVFQDITARKRTEANLAFLAEASEDLVRMTNIDETMSSLCAKIGGHFKAARVVFAEIGENETTSVIRHEWRQDGLPTLKEAAELKNLLTSKLEAAQRDGEISYIRDVAAELRDAGLTLTELGIASLLGAPLVRDEKLHLYLGILDSEPREWHEDEIELMRELTARIKTTLERARAEAALRLGEARLQVLLDEMPMGAYLIDADFRVSAVNPTALPVFGEIPDLIGRDFDEVIHRLWSKEYADEIVRLFRHTLETGEPYYTPERIEERLDLGVTEYYEWNITRIPLPDGRNGVVCYFRDVSAQVFARLKIAASEEKYRTLFDSMDEAYSVVEVLADENGVWNDFIFLEVNPAFIKQTGMEYPVGRRATELLGTPNPRWAQIYGQVATTGEAVRFEEHEETLDRIFDLYVFRLGGADSRRVAVLFTDITERKRAQDALRESEERFRLFVTATSDIVYRMSANWSEMYLLEGKSFLADTRNSSPTWLEEYIPESDKALVKAAINEAVRAKTTLELEHRVIQADDSIGWVFSRAIPFLDDSGEIVEWFGAATDITERKRAEEAMRIAEERYLALFNSIEQGFCTLEVAFDERNKPLDYRFLEVSPSFERQTGIPNAAGRTMREIAPDQDEHWFEIYGRIALSGEPERFETYSTPLNRWWSVYAFRIQDPALRRVDVLFFDVTSRKQSEEALRESEARLRALVENLPGGAVFIVDKNLRYLVAEGEALAAAGFAPEDLVGRTISEAMPPKLAESYEPMYRQALAGEAFEHEHEAHDRTFISRGVPLNDAAGEVYAVLAISYDITERKRAEEALAESETRLRLLIESASDYAIFTMTPDGLIDSWNTGAEKVFGWKETEVLGKPSAIIFTPEDCEKGAPEQEIETALRMGRAPDERFHIRKDGSRFYASGVMTVLKNDGGVVQGFAKIARDMTEQIAAERALRDKELLQKLVGAQETERKRIARDLHDELGQQLTALRLKLDAAKKLCEGGELYGKVDEIELLAKSIDHGVDFLAWELRPAALDDLGLVAALENYVKQWSHHSGVTAELISSTLKKARFEPEVETNLYRIVQEALNNTHKHARAKGAEVMLERRDGLIVMLIEDNGVGFNPKDKKNSLKGIGLIGMKERAQLIGGTLEIESAPEKGTTVFVRVPAESVKGGAPDDK